MFTTVALGLTHTDRAANYIPSLDGYRPFAPQTEVRFNFDAAETVTAEQIAEAVFVATNAPTEVIDASPLATAVFDSLSEEADLRGFFRSVSVGDTVVVMTADKTTALKCERAGWSPIF